MLALTEKPIKTYYWTRRVKRYKSGGLYGKLGQNLASYCGEGGKGGTPGRIPALPDTKAVETNPAAGTTANIVRI